METELLSAEWYMYLFYFFIFPGFMFSLIMGLVASWVDRKVTARVQWRVGPPVLQPVYDLIKLLGKEVMVPTSAHPTVFIFAPLVGLGGAVLSTVLLGSANFLGQAFIGDLIVLIYLLLLPSLAIVVGGSASGNPHSAIGSSREMKLILAYELPLALAVITVIVNSGFSLNLVEIATGWGLTSVSGFLAFLVTLVCIQAKLAEVPFDLPEAETELMEGPLIEYSGFPLALFKTTEAILLYLLPLYVITLFMGGINSGWGYLYGALKYVLILVLIILAKNTNPRVRIDQAVKFFWTRLTALAFLAVSLAIIGRTFGVAWL